MDDHSVDQANLEVMDPIEGTPVLTSEDLESEELELDELDRKKKALEETIAGMERDLGGLMR